MAVVPGQPLISRIEPSQSSIKLSWKKPQEDGGTDINLYTAKVKRNSNLTHWSSCKTTKELSCVISGVDIDKGYTVELQAQNQVGKGSVSRGTLTTDEYVELAYP